MRAGQLLDELPRLDDLLGIEAGGRLVEDEHLGIVQDGLRESDALPIAFRELSAVAVRHVVDARAAHRFLDAVLPLARRHPLGLDARDELQILAHRHLGIERRRFRQIAGAALGLDRLVEHVESGDDRLAFRRRHVAGQNAHGRRLAGAVRAEEAEDFSPLDAEVQIVDRGDAAVAFGEVLNLNQRRSP